VLVDDLGKADVVSEMQRLYGCPVSVCIGEARRIAETIERWERTPRVEAQRDARPVSRLSETGEQGQAAAEIVDHIIARALRDGASDIHVEPMQSKVRVS